MKRFLSLLYLLCFAIGAFANDGAFYANGNHLIPIAETDIRVQKEILSLKRNGNSVSVSVYYEFFNPVGAKDLLVGFEAPPPYPYNKQQIKRFPEHPYISGFNVKINGTYISWNIAHVDDNLWYGETEYYRNGKIQSLTRRQCFNLCNSLSQDEYCVLNFPFGFVYYFTAHFKPGLNIIEHTYSYQASHDGGSDWHFPYILTAACRWANEQIDDFTLHIDMDHTSFCVEHTFFDDYREWTFDGVGNVEETEWQTLFNVREGGITFHKKDFCPKGELRVFKSKWFCTDDLDIREVLKSEYRLLNPLKYQPDFPLTKNDKLILRNLPFAFRGCVFENAFLQRYFESTSWYIPDPSYKANMKDLSKEEREYILLWKQ